MANQLSRTDSSSNQDIRQRFNVKKTIIGVIVLLIGLFHLPEAILLIMDGISLDSILYLIGNILLCLLGIYQLKFRSREMRYLPTKSVVKEKNYSFLWGIKLFNNNLIPHKKVIVSVFLAFFKPYHKIFPVRIHKIFFCSFYFNLILIFDYYTCHRIPVKTYIPQ